MAKRGDTLEEMLIWSCRQYKELGVANIVKVPTNYKVVQRLGARGLRVVPESKTAVDFLGDFKGVAFALEAKSTENKTRYPLEHFDSYKAKETLRFQLQFMRAWKGLKFFLVGFMTLGEYYLIPSHIYEAWYEDLETKSIPIAWFRTNAQRVQTGRVALDFLQGVRT